MIIYIIIFLWCVVGFLILSFWSLSSDFIRIDSKLDELTYSANKAKTIEEVIVVWNELKIINKECFHHSLSAKSLIIKTILETKYGMLNQNK